MENFTKLPLEIGRLKLFVKKDQLLDIKDELKTFTGDISYFNSEDFPKKVLFPYELKSNNLIEGYQQDISSIVKIINNPYLKANKLDKEYQRIYNLFRGYSYILEKPDINESNLYNLYQLLSKKLLEDNEKVNINYKYRQNVGYIFNSSNIIEPPEVTMNPKLVPYYMNQLFDYINTNNENLTKEELFFKSQIAHFFFVNIHPYYDINGRTSRTLSLWFLNNNEAYPYTIFNRFIPYNKKDYYNIIRETKIHRNITPFLQYISRGTKLELEKEYVVSNLIENCKYKVNQTEEQVLHYILSNNGNNTLIDLTTFYNRYNPKESITYINNEILEPLIDSGIILRGNNTNKQYKDDKHNYYYSINSELLSINESKIKRLNLNKYVR